MIAPIAKAALFFGGGLSSVLLAVSLAAFGGSQAPDSLLFAAALGLGAGFGMALGLSLFRRVLQWLLALILGAALGLVVVLGVMLAVSGLHMQSLPLVVVVPLCFVAGAVLALCGGKVSNAAVAS